MTAWGICATVKAPADQVLAFVAHHQWLGASRIWLHFDDPEDAAAGAVAGLAGVEATRCDAAYWQALVGRRPERHQNRQARNMQRVYALAALPWVAHIDVDEFLWPAHPIADLLAATPEDQPMLRAPPWEALHDPALSDDIFTARHFRAALKGEALAPLRDAAFGPHAPLLPDGVLSHAAGKAFFRTGLARFEPRIHGAFRAGSRVTGIPFCPDLALLHFHAEDRARWLDRLAFRITRGAYRFNPALADWLAGASGADIAAFYDRVQVALPDTLARLNDAAALIEADLHLRDRVATLALAGTTP